MISRAFHSFSGRGRFLVTSFLVASLLTQMLALLPSFRRLELELYDTQMLLWREGLSTKSVDPRIVWVGLDDASKSKGWNDQKTLALLDDLVKAKVAGVLLCGREVFLSGVVPAIPSGGPVLALEQAQAEPFLSGSTNSLADFDGRMRSFPSDHRVVTLFQSMAARLGVVSPGPSGERFHILFPNLLDASDTGRADTFMEFLSIDSLGQRLAEPGKAKLFEGKWVILERTSASAETWHLETSRGKVGAGALYVNGLQTLLEGWDLQPVQGFAALLLSELLLLGLTLLFNGRRAGTLFLWSVAACLTMGVVSLWAFSNGLWLPLARLLWAVASAALVSAVLGYRRANRALSDLGGSENARLEGKETDATILFTELPAYLTDLEKTRSEELLAHRRDYNSVLEAIARKYHGQILDYQGDFQMVGFGLRYDNDNEHPMEAASAAAEIVAAVPELSRIWGVPVEKTRVHAGICTGPVALGHVGATQKQDVAAIGDTTNTAARVLAAAIGMDRSVLLAGSTFTAARDHLSAESLPPLELKGKSQPVEVFALGEVDAQWQQANLASKKGRIPSGGKIEYSPRTRGVLVVTLLFSTVAYLFSLGVGTTSLALPWELGLRDAVVNRFAPAPSDHRIVLVGLDSESCADPRLGELPWNRSVYAEAIGHLSRTKMAGAFFDVVFRQPSSTDPQGDRALAEALMGDSRVSVAVTLGRPSMRLAEPLFFLPDDQRETLRRRHQLGLIHSHEDLDGVLRRAVLAAAATDSKDSQRTVLYPTGALTLLLDAEDTLQATSRGLEVAGRLLPTSMGTFPHELELRFGPAATASPPQKESYRYVSFHRLLDPSDPIFTELEGAYLLIGDSFAQGERFKIDRVSTPVGQIKGVEFHARTLDTILNSSWIVPLPQGLEALWTLLLVIATTGILVRFRYFRDYAPRVVSVMAVHAFVWLTLLLAFSRSSAFFTPLLTVVAVCAAALLGRYLLAFRALSWFLPQEVADELMLTQQARDRRVLATVLLTDIRGYTTIAEGRSALDMLSFLNEYHKRTVACYTRYGGQVLTYQGDAQIVVFGVFGRRARPAVDAVKAALELQSICEILRREWKLAEEETFEVGAGLCTGMVEVGWLGGQENLQYSVVGETVRKTHKVQSLSAELQASVLLDQETFEALEGQLACEDLGDVPMKGMEGTARLYRPSLSPTLPGSPEEEKNNL